MKVTRRDYIALAREVAIAEIEQSSLVNKPRLIETIEIIVRQLYGRIDVEGKNES